MSVVDITGIVFIGTSVVVLLVGYAGDEEGAEGAFS